MVLLDDLHAGDQPATPGNPAIRVRMGARRTGQRAAPCGRAPGGSFAEQRRRSKMQHATALEAGQRPGLRWVDLRMHTCADTRRGDRGQAQSSREKTAGGRDPFFANPYYPDGR
jgi:hypothetical protein